MACPTRSGKQDISATPLAGTRTQPRKFTNTEGEMNSKTGFAKGQLKTIVERIERLEEEKKTIAADIKEIYAEAKGNGFDTRILRKVISIRRKDRHEREEEEAMLEIYLDALGMLVSATEEAA